MHVCQSITVCLINTGNLVHDLEIKKIRVDTILPVHIHQVSGSLPFGPLYFFGRWVSRAPSFPEVKASNSFVVLEAFA